MAQTTAQVAQACSKLEVSFNGTDYTDISGVSQSITGLSQTRATGEAYTFDGDTALITAGKRQPMSAKVAVVYTETDAEGYEIVREQFETAGCNVPIWIRYTPRGTGAGHEQLTLGKCQLESFDYPSSDASQGGPIIAGFTAKAPSVATTLVAS